MPHPIKKGRGSAVSKTKANPKGRPVKGMKAFTKGYDARVSGASIDDAPHSSGSHLHRHWCDGWRDADVRSGGQKPEKKPPVKPATPAYQEGGDAAVAGVFLHRNPHFSGSHKAVQWADGWADATARMPAPDTSVDEVRTTVDPDERHPDACQFFRKVGYRVRQALGQVFLMEPADGQVYSAQMGEAWQKQTNMDKPPWRSRGHVDDLPADLAELIGTLPEALEVQYNGQSFTLLHHDAPKRSALWHGSQCLFSVPDHQGVEVMTLAAAVYFHGLKEGVRRGRIEKAKAIMTELLEE